MFESFLSRDARAAAMQPAVATTASGMPIRTAFLYHPNGVNLRKWHPTGEGRDFTLGKTHEPIAAFKDKLQIFANLDQVNATAGPDGGGDHARAPGVWLTGLRIKKSEKDIRANTSIDQVMAQRIGNLTRLPSLELISDGTRKTGNCDSGYSCEYEFNVSWRSPTTPNPPEPNPRLVFERLFGSGAPEERRRNLMQRQATRRSMLDFVLDDAKRMNLDLGVSDQRKLDEYLYSVREIERRITNVERLGHLPDPGVEAPTGMPGDFSERIDVMLEMMALAFITDSTRISTLILARDGDNRVFDWLGQTGGHHSTSHYKNNENRAGNTPEQNLQWMAEIEYWYMQRFATFLHRLEEAKDADGSSVLDNSIIMYGAGNADSNSHTHNNLPTLIVGKGGGALNSGRYVNCKPGRDPLLPPANRGGDGAAPAVPGTPMCNFYLGLLEKLGISDVDQFGDSTGRFTNI
ncbi:MAG: DUF1552 domain-containing protein [Planctomycetaceae bacterium]|nr:DUF1552 domain-containing protein [Planctomycetaceae bacterium]